MTIPPIVPGSSPEVPPTDPPMPLPGPAIAPIATAPRRGMSAALFLVIIVGGVCVVCTVITLGIAAFRVSSSQREAQPPAAPTVRATSVTTARTTVAATAPSTQPAAPSSVASGVPGLAPAAASHIELKSATAVPFLGFQAYSLILSNGAAAWAIKGTPAAVVPKVLADPSYSSTGSVLFLSGDYVLYFPKLSAMPQAFIVYTGPRPAMSVIDIDQYM